MILVIDFYQKVHNLTMVNLTCKLSHASIIKEKVINSFKFRCHDLTLYAGFLLLIL